MDRRELIKRTAIAGGVAWAAPQILRTQAAAAATPPCVGPGTINWETDGFERNAPGQAGFPWLVGTRNGVSLGMDLTGAFLVFGKGASTGVKQLSIAGGQVGFFRVQKNEAPAGDIATLTLRFSVPVFALSFSIYDIDAIVDGTVVEADEVTVRAFATAGPPSGPVAPTTVDVGAAVAGSYPTFTGVAPASKATSRGTVAMAWTTLVQEVQIDYISRNTLGEPSGPTHIGLSDITWDCTSV